MWSKSLQNTFKEFIFGLRLAVGMHLYSRTSSCAAVFNCFIIVEEQLVFCKCLQLLILRLLFLVRDVAVALFKLSFVSYNLSSLF